MTDSKYFTTTKKGEIFELKSELNSDKKERKKERQLKRVDKINLWEPLRKCLKDEYPIRTCENCFCFSG